MSTRVERTAVVVAGAIAVAAFADISCKSARQAASEPAASSASAASRAAIVPADAAAPASVDAGAVTAEAGFADGMYVAAEDDVYLYTSGGSISRSVDGGTTFVAVAGRLEAELVALSGGANGRLYAVTDHAILVSDDHGASWTSSGDIGAAHGLSAIWSDRAGSVAYVVGSGVVLSTADGGAHWAAYTFPGATEASAVWAASARDVYVLGVTRAGARRGEETSADAAFRHDLFESHDGAAHFRRAALGPHEQLFALGGTGPEDVYVTGTVGKQLGETPTLFHTRDGARWTHAHVGTGLLVSIWTASPGNVFLGTAWRGLGGSVLHSDDAIKWTSLLDGLVDVQTIQGSGVSGGAVYVLCGRGQMERSPGGSAPFVEISPAKMEDP